MVAFIEANPGKFPLGLAEVGPFGGHAPKTLNEKTILACRIGAKEHSAFLTSPRASEAYVEFWNSRVAGL